MVMPQVTSHPRYSFRRWWLISGLIIAMTTIFAGTVVGLKIATTNSRGSIPALATISPAIPPMSSLQSAIKKPALEAQIPDGQTICSTMRYAQCALGSKPHRCSD